MDGQQPAQRSSALVAVQPLVASSHVRFGQRALAGARQAHDQHHFADLLARPSARCSRRRRADVARCAAPVPKGTARPERRDPRRSRRSRARARPTARSPRVSGPGMGTTRLDRSRSHASAISNGVASWRAATSCQHGIGERAAPALRTAERPVRQQQNAVRDAVLGHAAQNVVVVPDAQLGLDGGNLRDATSLPRSARRSHCRDRSTRSGRRVSERRAPGRWSRAAFAGRAHGADRDGCDRRRARAGWPRTRRRDGAPARPRSSGLPDA